MSSQRILELFEEIDDTPVGPQERALIDEAVALAVDLGDEELEYRARLRLTASAVQTGDTDTVLSSFAWCLAKHDSDPGRFPADLDTPAGDLMWQYKWIPETLGDSPIFPRSDIDAVLADMREHYLRAGLGMSGVITAQFKEAWSNGRIDEAERLHTTLVATPRDDHSHCDACVRSESIGFLTEIGRESEALTLMEEMVDGGFSCADEPEHALSRALILYLRAGRFADAKTAHLRSYRLARNNPDNIEIVANHLVFCAITGNEARGLTILERHIGWLAHDGLNVSAHFASLLAYGVLLDAIDAAGHGDIPVRGADAEDLVAFFGRHDGAWTVGELAAAAWAAAARIGEAFDTRNGNDYFARRLDHARALATERYDVPIHTDTFIAESAPPPDPTGAGDWLERAYEMAAVGDAERLLTAARAALDLTSGEDRERSYALVLSALVHLERWSEADAVLPERIRALRDGGRKEQADVEERRGLALFGRDTAEDRVALEAELAAAGDLPDDVVAGIELALADILIKSDEPDVARVRSLIRDAVDRYDAPEGGSAATGEVAPEGGSAATGESKPDTRRELLAALSFQAHFDANCGDVDGARTAIERVIAAPANRGFLATGYVLRARLWGTAGNFEEAVGDAEEASRLFSALDTRRSVVSANALAGELYADAGRHGDAIIRLRYAVSQARAIGGAHPALRYRLGRALTRGGQHDEAIEVLMGVFDDETEAGAPPESRGETLYWLGQAFSDNDQPGFAVDAWNSAVELFVEGSDTRGAAKAGMAAGRLLGQYGETEHAVKALDDAAARARETPEDAGLLIAVLHAQGTAHANNGSPAGLDILDEVLDIARRHEATWLIADVTDSRARALKALGRSEEAIREALTAADRYLEAGDPTGAGFAELLAGRILVEAGRRDEAAGVMRTGFDHAEINPQLRSLIALELGDVLEDLGRVTEANEVRGVL